MTLTLAAIFAVVLFAGFRLRFKRPERHGYPDCPQPTETRQQFLIRNGDVFLRSTMARNRALFGNATAMATGTMNKPKSAGAPQAANTNGKKAPSTIKFPIAARRKYSLGPTPNAINMSAAGALVNLGPIEIPATGFLRYLDVIVVGTTAANAATVAFAADAPFNALQYITLTNAAGDTIIVPVDGYALAMFKKYGALSEDPPWCDPRSSRWFSVTSGVGSGLGGSFSMRLKIPLEIDPQSAFGAVPSMASNKSLQLGVQVAPTSAVYSTAPTTPPSVAVTLYQAFWAQPKPTNGRGAPQATVPVGNNSVMMWRVDTPTVAPGDKLIKINNIGNVLRMLLLIYRTASGARTSADIPAIHTWFLNNDQQFYLPDTTWQDDMAEAYGYTGSSADVAGGLDTGVRAFHYLMASDGRVRSSSVREQFLPTLDTTLMQYRGTSFGANISQLQIYTCEIKPTSSQALYADT